MDSELEVQPTAVQLWKEKYQRLQDEHKLLQLAAKNMPALQAKADDIPSGVEPIPDASIIPQKRVAEDNMGNPTKKVRVVGPPDGEAQDLVNQLIEENRQLKQELNVCQSQSQNASRESAENMAELRAQLEEDTRRIRILMAKNHELEVEMETSRAQTETLASEISHLREELLLADSVATKSREELEAAQARIFSLKAEYRKVVVTLSIDSLDNTAMVGFPHRSLS
ncbi:hypothetical protein C8R43DRAFT_950590 [Mycena crocata]|nr:hypothetical protein C8R43DRAFT_950590 [Mycena crocata]